MIEALDLSQARYELIKQREERNSNENPANPLTFPVEMWDGLYGPQSDAGVRVSEIVAMQEATVYACVRVRAESVGSMPLNVFEDQGKDGVRLASELGLFDLLHDRPNPFMTSVVFREAMQMSLDLWGNAYAQIQRDNANRVVALWPRSPSKTYPFLVEDRDQYDNRNQRMVFATTDGVAQGGQAFINAEDMIHLCGPSFDGLVGMSVIRSFAKNTIGLSMAATQFGSRFFSNGANPGGIITVPANLTDKQKQDLRTAWMEAQAGRNQGRPAVLTSGIEWTSISIPPDDAQFLQTRKFQKEEICGLYRVPPHKVGNLEKSTNNNIEHQALEFVVDTVTPIVHKWEQELTYKLFPKPTVGRNASKRFFVNFDVSEIIPADSKTRMDTYATAKLNGIYTVNEVRRKLNMNPVQGGDVLTVQAQNIPLTDAVKSATPDAPAEPLPDAVGSDAAETNASKLVPKYLALFRDAFGRVTVRDKTDFKAIQKAFHPLLATISGDISALATRGLKTDLPPEKAPDMVTRQLKAITERCTDWSDEHLEAEFVKVIRGLTIDMFKEIAVAKAKAQFAEL